MNQPLNKRLLNTGRVIFSFLTIIFSVLSVLNVSNRLFSILSQGFLGMTFMFIGVREFAYGNDKKFGYSLIILSTILFCVMFFSIYVAFKVGAF